MFQFPKLIITLPVYFKQAKIKSVGEIELFQGIAVGETLDFKRKKNVGMGKKATLLQISVY